MCPGTDDDRLIYELRTRQIELEMQNEELRRAQRELEASRNRYVELYDFAPAAYFTFDEDCVIREINLAGAGLLGFSKRHLINKPFPRYIANEDGRTMFREHCGAVIARQGRKTCEIMLRKKDGTVFSVQVQSSAVERGSDGEERCRTAMIDITERKRAEEALAKLASFPLLNPNPVIEADLNGNIGFMNPAAEKSFPDLRTSGAQHPLLQGLESIAAMMVKDGALNSHVRDINTSNGWYEQAIYFVQGKNIVRFYLRNITERKQAEEALRRSEAILAHAGKMARLGAWDIQISNHEDLNANPLRWSDETYRIFGYEPGQAEVTNDFFFESVHPEDRQKIVDAVAKAIARKEPYSIEHRVSRPDGAEIMVAEYAEITFDEQGRPHRIIGAVQDITERKQTEESLKMARDELELRVRERTAQVMGQSRILESFFRHTQTCLVFLDREFNFLRVNEAYARTCARDVSDFSGHNHFVDYPSEELKEKFQRVVDTKEPYSVFGRPFIFPDHPERGTTYWDLDVAPILDGNGEVELLVVSLLDVTERKRAEAELARLAEAVASTADAIVITDARGAIEYVNPAFERITGYTRDEVMQRDLHILDSGKHDQEFFRMLRETLARNGVWRGRLINKKKDDGFYFEDCTCSPVKGPSGEIRNYVSVKRDVTARLRLESIAESVNTMDNIGYIFSGVRHEIGNPINTAKMVLSVLRQKLEQSSQETIRDYIGRALREIGRVEYHLKTLKNFNLYETLEPGNVNMASFMDSFLSLVIPDLEKKGMAITMKFQSGAEWAYADPRALQQALLNLVTNAADALEGRQGPTIAITVSKREKSVLIQIQDNGCGMSEEEQKTLFKPFVTSKKKGTGLGLVLVKKMLTKMNGSIEISSRLNVGTTVDIMIPEGTNDACEQENTPDH
jgi:PAS domain S-box-containing protein